jgi:hypothetical protein
MFRKPSNYILLAGFSLALAGCGHSQGDRAVSGGLIGAGTGAVIGSVTGVGPVGGALVGGAVGAVGGAATSPDTINLGKPIWK